MTGTSALPFRHGGGAAGRPQSPEITGSGGALFDYDHDGDLDVYLVDVDERFAERPAAAPRVNRLYRREGDGSWVDVTERSGLGDRGYGMGAALGDVDNDGDQDIFVTNLGPDALYLNRGDGTFAAAGPDAGLDADVWSTSACFLDYDGDGRLDLYVATYLQFDPATRCTDRSGNPEFCGPEAFRGVPDLLYRGRGDGSFVEVSDRALPGRPPSKALGVICADLGGDGLPDVYVANDGEQNQLWINRGGGTFEERALLLGAGLNLFGQPEASMGVVAGDIDGDLDPDLFMTHLDRETNTLYVNLGEAGFEDRTPATGLGPPGMPYTGFGTGLLDADHDGDLDLAVVNGRVRRGASLSEREERRRTFRVDEALPAMLRDYAEPNLLLVNEGGGRFRDASAEAGWRERTVEVSRGLLVGDLDHDGDLDLLITNCGGQARLFRNDLPGKGHWVKARVVDPALRRDALGAVVEVHAAGTVRAAPVLSSSGYLSTTDPWLHLGLGEAAELDRLAAVWPGGGRSRLHGLPADRAYWLWGPGATRRESRR